MQNRSLKTILLQTPTVKPNARRTHPAEAIWRQIRAISVIFTLLILLVLLIGHLRASAIDPLKSPDLSALKVKLRQNPTDERAKTEIRRLDLQLRTRYFRQLSQSSSGVYLLLAGVAVLVLSAGRCAHYQKQPPMPKPRTDAPDPGGAARAARWSVSA